MQQACIFFVLAVSVSLVLLSVASALKALAKVIEAIKE